MTINEMIRELEKLAKEGYGEYKVVNAEDDDVSSVCETSKSVVIYFE